MGRMNNKYSKENVNIGDRVLVSGCEEEYKDRYWGTVLEHYEDEGTHVRMDDDKLLRAFNDVTTGGTRCYYAWWEEVYDLVKVDVLPEDDSAISLEIIPVTEPDPLSKVVEDLMATHRYLEQVTGKTYSAQLKGFDLESDNGYDSNMITIQFVMEEQ